MRIYTEVNYIWKDNKLIQTDSESFDYEGEISKCDSRRGGPRWARYNIPHSHWVPPTVKDVKEVVAKGPGGTTGQIADELLGGSTKDAVESVQQTYRDFEGGVQNIRDQILSYMGYGEGGNGGSSTTSNPLLEEDTGAGSRGTASGRRTEASGRSSKGRRGIERKDKPRSIINQQMQKRLA